MRYLLSLPLRVQLMALMLIAFAPAFVLLIHSAGVEKERHEVEVRTNMSSLASDAASRHSHIVERARELLLALASVEAVHELDGRRCSALFAQLLPRYPQYLNLVVANAEGDIFCSARPMQRQVNVKSEPSFARALANRGLAFGELSTSKVTGRPFLGQGYPVLGASGEVVAVIGAILDVDWLNREVTKTSLPAAVVLTVTDEAGNVVVQSPSAAQWVGKSIRDTALFAAQRGSTPFSAARGVDGVERLHGHAKVGNVPAPSALYVSVGLDEETAFGPARAALRRNLTWLTIITLFALSVVWYGSRLAVTNPMRHLLLASRRVAAGDRDARASLATGAREIAELGNQFEPPRILRRLLRLRMEP